MTPKILFRIASIALVLHDLGHSSQIILWTHGGSPQKQQVIDVMRSQRFSFMGAVHSMGDAFEGFIWTALLAMLFFATVLWLISNDTATALARRIAIALFIVLTGWWIVEFVYFFPFAAINTMVAWLCIGVALLRMRRTTS